MCVATKLLLWLMFCTAHCCVVIKGHGDTSLFDGEDNDKKGRLVSVQTASVCAG